MTRSYTIDLDSTDDRDETATTATWAGDGKIQAAGTSTDFYISSFSFTYEGALSTIMIGGTNEYEFQTFGFNYEESANGSGEVLIFDPNKTKRDSYSIGDEVLLYLAGTSSSTLTLKWGGYITDIDISDYGVPYICVKSEGYAWKWQLTPCSTTTYPDGDINTFSEIVNDIMTLSGFTTSVESDTDTPASVILATPTYTKKKAIEALSDARNKRAWITPDKVMTWKSKANLTDSSVILSIDAATDTLTATKFSNDTGLVNVVEVIGQGVSTTRTDSTSVSTYGTHFESRYAPHLNTAADIEAYGDKILDDESELKIGYNIKCTLGDDIVSPNIHEKIKITSSALGLDESEFEIVRIDYKYEATDKGTRTHIVTFECGEL